MYLWNTRPVFSRFDITCTIFKPNTVEDGTLSTLLFQSKDWKYALSVIRLHCGLLFTFIMMSWTINRLKSTWVSFVSIMSLIASLIIDGEWLYYSYEWPVGINEQLSCLRIFENLALAGNVIVVSKVKPMKYLQCTYSQDNND